VKPIFEGEILDVAATENGLIYAYCEDRSETQITVAFKMISFEGFKETNVAKNIYLLSKFGPDYKAFSIHADNYISCKIITFPGEQMLILEDDGTVKFLNDDATLLYDSKINYVNENPSGIALSGDKLWCSYKDKNVIIRYNINTMREELRLGGGRNTPFSMPTDIFVEGGYAYIASSGTKSVLKVDLNSYALESYKELEVNVNRFFRIAGFDFIVNENGLYMI
jgi:hypothetical protein